MNEGILVISFLPEYQSNILTPCVQEIDDLMAGGVGVEQPDEDELLAELGELLGDEVTINSCHESDQTLFFLYKCFSYKVTTNSSCYILRQLKPSFRKVLNLIGFKMGSLCTLSHWYSLPG